MIQDDIGAMYLTVRQVAELLQVSTRTVQRLVESEPTLPVLKLGGVLRFPRARLERWLRDREAGAPRTRSQVRSTLNLAPRQEASPR